MIIGGVFLLMVVAATIGGITERCFAALAAWFMAAAQFCRMYRELLAYAWRDSRRAYIDYRRAALEQLDW